MSNTQDAKSHLPKAVMFDLDGTLVKSTIDFMKFRTRLLGYIERKGADMSAYSLNFTTVTMIAKFEDELRSRGVEEKIIDAYLDEIESFLNEIELERIEKTRPVRGAKVLLDRLKGSGVKIGILTRGSPEYARRALAISGLTEFVDATIARERKSGIKPKPSPESAFALAAKLGVPASESVMVGDYSIDFLCARDSKIKFYGIASDSESKKSLTEAGCKLILKNLAEFRTLIGI